MSSEAGLLLVLSAPSGAGKTTLARRFLAGDPTSFFSVSVTTRAPRGAEQEGVDYHFVTPERFAGMVEGNALAEWAEVHGHHYGTLRETVEQALSAGRTAVFDIDVQGGSALKRQWPREVVTIFILPPSMSELERRLRLRSTEPDEGIHRRLATAREEIAQGAQCYDYIVINDDLEAAHRKLTLVASYQRALLSGSPAAALKDAVRACERDQVTKETAWLHA